MHGNATSQGRKLIQWNYHPGGYWYSKKHLSLINALSSLQNAWKNAWQKRTWCCWLTALWTWSTGMPRLPRIPRVLWLESEILCPAGSGWWLSHGLSTSEATPQIPCSVLGLWWCKWHWCAGKSPGKGNGAGEGNTSLMKGSWRTWGCLAWNKEDSGGSLSLSTTTWVKFITSWGSVSSLR